MKNPKSARIVIDDDTAPGSCATAGGEGDSCLELGGVLQVHTAAELLGNKGVKEIDLTKFPNVVGFRDFISADLNIMF